VHKLNCNSSSASWTGIRLGCTCQDTSRNLSTATMLAMRTAAPGPRLGRHHAHYLAPTSRPAYPGLNHRLAIAAGRAKRTAAVVRVAAPNAQGVERRDVVLGLAAASLAATVAAAQQPEALAAECELQSSPSGIQVAGDAGVGPTPHLCWSCSCPPHAGAVARPCSPLAVAGGASHPACPEPCSTATPPSGRAQRLPGAA
jgi:hypothetical protein